MDFAISGKAVMTVASEAGPRLKHRERAKYTAAIYDAPKKRFLNVYRTQIPPATALKDEVLMSNGQHWGHLFDYLACSVKLYTLAEGEEYTDQKLGVTYDVEDWTVFRQVLCPELSRITKGYSLFTGYETRWEGTPDTSGRVFHRVKLQRINGRPCGCVEFYVSTAEIRNQNIRAGGSDGDFRLRMLIPLKSWPLMELQMLELLDSLFVQSQKRQSIVRIKKCIIYTNPEDYDSKQPQEDTTSGEAAPKESEVSCVVNPAQIPRGLVQE